MSGRGSGRPGRARRSRFLSYRCPDDERLSTTEDMDINFLVLIDESDLRPDSELEIPKEHGSTFLLFYQNAIINLTSIHPSKSTPVFLKYDDFMEDYCLSSNWYDFSKDYGLEHGDQVLFELEAIGGGIPPEHKITVIKATT